jgi:flavin-dependent dehydrogenase
MAHEFDVAVVGAGPAGSACAAICAAGGLRTVLIERSTFPREKVCGDCINPACWPVLDRLGVAARILAQPHSRLAELEFIGIGGRLLRFPLHADERGEIALKRSLFDSVLLERARECGAEIRMPRTLTGIEHGWTLHAQWERIRAHTLVAADGRNSTVARLLGVLPPARRERVAAQMHFVAPSEFGDRVAMRLLPRGYCGLANVGGGEANLCVVSDGAGMGELKAWAVSEFALPPDAGWRTVAPLARAPVPCVQDRALFVGDAARVVEPFTGEGIYYALASGELAARHLLANELPGYAPAHARLYRGRVWVNEIARFAVLHPRTAGLVLRVAPAALRFLTAKVTRPPASGLKA